MSFKIYESISCVEHLAHTKIADCYQCGKCTAGCPRGEKMVRTPSQLMRFVQTGLIEEAAKSVSIWQCVSCLTCSARCPKSVNVAGVIDALRQIAIEKKWFSKEIASSVEKTIIFQQEFLRNIRRNGRTNELELVAAFKIRGFLRDLSIPQAFKDSMLGPKMLSKGKLHFKIGSPVQNKDLVRRIFDKCGVK